MPPVRTSTKKEQRERLSARIRHFGYEMSPACSTCVQHDRKCIVLPQDSGRCSECVWRGFSCDAKHVSVSDWSAIERAEQRIRAEKKEALAKLLRLERQEEFLRKRGLDMLRRGLRSLEDLEKAEDEDRRERERKEKEETERREQEAPAATSAASTGASSDPLVGYSGVVFDGDLSVLPDSFWNDFGVGGTASQDSRS
jgi:hypothetical protein